MPSNYKKLGKYINPVNRRNKELEVNMLLGVSIKKKLMPSIANTVGTDMSRYKIIRKEEFAYGPVTSRNGDKISVALLLDFENAIVSQAYTVFEIKNHEELDPEYLMMWFRRPEFDRYARFKSHGSARETFDWDEMCDVELPVPSIEKQRAIVKEYNTVVNRIKLNEQLNQKLEATAQALYKHWFVDFEFPDKKGQPYKSGGGKMVWNEELEQEVPEGWEVDDLVNLTKLLKRGIAPKYVLESELKVINQKCIRNNTVNLKLARFHNILMKNVPDERMIKKWDVLVNSTGTGTLGRVGLVKNDKNNSTVDTHVTIVRSNTKVTPLYLWGFLSNNTKKIEELAEGSTGQTELSRENLGSLRLLIAKHDSQIKFSKILVGLINHSFSIENFESKLTNFKNMILSKMSQPQA